MQTYKSDNDIAAEFKGFVVDNVEYSHRTSGGARSGYITVTWPNGEESVGGGIENGDTTTDNWIDYDGDGVKIAFGSWYPDNVYTILCDAIRRKLAE